MLLALIGFLLPMAQAQTAGQVRYFPRVGLESRMVGGQFQGSTDNSTWTTFYTVTTAPGDTYTTAATSADPATFRYLRYLAPDGSYGNVAEIEFDSGGVKLTGTTFGTPGSYNNGGSDYTKVFDGDTTTSFDALYPGNGDYAGIDQGPFAQVGQVRYFPRVGLENRMVGGQFQGSTDNSTWTTFYTVTTTPGDTYTTAPITSGPRIFRYLRYLAPDGSYGNVAEIEFDSGTGSNAVKLTGTLFGTPGSNANSGNDYTKVFDGDTTTFFDALYPGNGDYAGIDQGLHLPPVGDVPPPGWAEEVIPSDSSDAGGNGPSASLSVSLPSGVLENHPGPDLDVYNPTGPSISYARLYRSALAASGTYTPGLSPGWRDNYSLTITSSGGGSYTLNYPNGGAENWTTVSGTITPPSGVPYLVNASGSALVMTFKDHSYYTFTPSPSNASLYLLTGLSNLAGSTVTINRDSANGNRITTFTNGGANPLLTLNYSGSGLANITDLYGRVVTYTFTASNLATVSQVNAASAIRWQYGYTTINAQPFLSAVMVPDPSSASISEADPQYAPGGYVTSLKDAEGNLRAYSYGPNAVSISIYGPNNALSQSWTQKFDPANHNVDMGIVDAFGHSTSLTYGDAANPLKVTAATNKNGQTATASFDKYGNTMAVSDLRSVTTQNSYDPTFLLGQVAQIQVGINQPTPKTPTNFTYYDGTTQVNGVTQAKGLMKTTSVPTPGTTGTGAQVTSTYVYTALGNAAQVVSPGPSTGGGTVTTTYNYTTDALYDGNGNAIQAGAPAYTAAEQLKQPLTVTDPLGNVTHYRYDARGNPIIVITAPVVSYPDTTIARGLRTDYAYNSQDQLTGIMYPALNPSTPTFRNSTVYAYEYVGGPLLTITELDQSNTVVRQTNVGKGKEDEQKAQAGSIQQANFSYDPQYRLKQLTDGNSNPAQKYSFDGVGNLTSKTYALGDGPQFTQYDNDNNLLQMKDGRGVTTTYTRAADDSRVTGVTYSDGTAAVNLGASGYDVYDRVTSYSDGVGSYTVSYDDDDNLLSKTTAYAGLPAATVSYSYNYDGSRATLTTPKALSGSTYSYWTFSYGYDSDGQVTSLTCPWAKSSTSTGLAVLSYYYDELGRMIKQHTQKGDTYYVYNSRGWLAQQQSANTYFPASFTDPNTNENNNTGRPLAGNIPNRTAQGQSVTGDLSYVLLDDYSNMQYDAVGNRLSMTVFLPDFYIYDSSGNYTSYPPLNKTFGGTLTYAYDIKDRLTLETTNNSSGTPTFNDYALSGGAELYNDNWNYQINADLADNLTTLRGNTQTFNADDQLTSQTYDGAGDRTSYDGGSVLYDANGLPISVPGNNGATPFTQTFTGEGDRAWKLPSGGSKTYYLYDGDALLMELSSTGAPVTTYAYGPSGLLERFQHTNAGVPYVLYLFDPNGNPVHRVRSIDPNVTSGAAVFVQDTALYDSTGLLHADIDTLTGGFNSGHLDPIGYKGELGNYTDLETQQAVAGLYTALSGPGGASYYDPMTGVGMARDQADSANEYSDNLNSVEPALHNTFVDVAGLVGWAAGPRGSALAAGFIEGEITYIETGDIKASSIAAAKTGVTTLVLGKAIGFAGKAIGGIIGRVTDARAAQVLAHLTSPDAAASINASGKIGSRYGVFAVAGKVPKSALGRTLLTLVPKNTSASVTIAGDAVNAFKAPIPVGPFSLARNLAGVRSSPLGSVDLSTGRFIENEVFENGAFRPATKRDILQYQFHQGLLDYGIDGGLYGIGATGTGAIIYYRTH